MNHFRLLWSTGYVPAGLLCLSLGLVGTSAACASPLQPTTPPAHIAVGPPAAVPVPTTSASQLSLLMQMQDAFTGIARSAEPFVVNIEAAHSLSTPESDEGGGDGSGGDGSGGDGSGTPGKSPKAAPAPSVPALPSFPKEEQATGSGLIIRSDGYILTNDHVVEGSSTVNVTLSDGEVFRGKVVNDFRSDLAVIKIDPGADKLTVAGFADSDNVQPGQWAIAIGSPFDLQNTMTVGVISALHRHQTIGDDPVSTRYYPDLIQTDAAINPGNSGGPLLNINGQVVGVNVAIESPVEGSAGVGFAIPANTALFIADQLIKNGKVIRGYLGLAPQDLTPALAKEFGVAAGAYIVQVDQDSPAGKAGLHPTDIITSFSDEPVSGELSLRNAIAQAVPGQSVTIAYVHNGALRTTTAQVTAAPPAQQDVPSVADQTPKVGISYRALTASDRHQLGLDPTVTGVIVTNVAPNSPADDAGVAQNDVIEKIDTTPIGAPADVDKALSTLVAGADETIVVWRSTGGKIQEIALDVQL